MKLINPAVLGLLAIIFVFNPMMRFFGSSTLNPVRPVDIALVFASGMMAGVLSSQILRTLQKRFASGRVPSGSGKP